MVYEAYERRIQKVARVLNFIRKHIVLFSTLAIATVALTTGFFSVRGIILEDVVCASESYVYGDEIRVTEAKALFSKVSYEYASEGSEEWSSEAPLLPGNYRIRAVSSRFIGSKGYGEPAAFAITQRDLVVYSDQSVTMYGVDPKADADGLLKQDSLKDVSFRFDNLQNPSNVTATPKESSVRICNRDGVDVTKGYKISVETKPIRLTPAPITVKVDDVSKFYDTTPLSSTAWSLAAGRVVAGDHVIVSFDPSISITEPGTVMLHAQEIRVMKGELDVTGYYQITEEGGALTVSLRPVTFVTAAASKVYDATPLSNGTAEIWSGSLTEGHTFRIVESSIMSITNVAESGQNRLLVEIFAEDGSDVSGWYNIEYLYGMLSITPRTVTVSARGGAKTYDAQTFSSEVLEALESVEGLLPMHTIPGYRYEINTGFDPVNAGTYTKLMNPMDILDESGHSVYANYSLTRVPGTLVIEQRSITLGSDDWSHVYNGSAIQWDGTPHVIGEVDFVEGHEPIYSYTAVGPNANTYSNEFSVVAVSDGVNSNLKDNYKFEYEFATLTITKRKVSFEAYGTSYQYTYSGSPITHADSVRVLSSANEDEGLIAGTVTFQSFSPVGPDVGVYDNVYTIARIEYRGENVINNYEILECRTIQLKILPRPIIVQSARSAKPYDRTPLSNPTFIEAASDLVAGHTLKWVGAHASQTVVGAAKNSFTADNVQIWNGTENVTKNYTITRCSAGTLEVTKRTLILFSHDDSKIYDANPFDLSADRIMINGHGLLEGDSIAYDFTEARKVINVWNTATGNFTFTPTVTMRDGENPDDCYVITCNPGTLTILPKDVTFVSTGAAKTYDQIAISAASIASVDGLVGDHTYKVPTDFKSYGPDVYRGSDGAPTYYQNTYTVTFIYDPNEPDVNLRDNYTVIPVYGELWINPIQIVLQTENESFTYNGRRQYGTADKVTTTGNYLIGQLPTYSFWGEGPNVGTYDNRVFSVLVRDTSGGYRDVTHNYEFDYTQQTGKLEITKRLLTVTTHGGTQVYNGQYFSGKNYTLAGLVSDDEYGMYHRIQSDRWVNIGPDVITDAEHTMTVLDIWDNLDQSVFENYEIKYEYGKVSITPRRVVIGTPDLIHYYDRTAVPGSGYAGYVDETAGLLDEGLVLKHAPKLHYTGSQLNIGSSPNTFTVLDIVDENNQSVRKNYTVVEGSAGTITVKPRELVIHTGSAKLTYNGQAQKYEFYTFDPTSHGLLKGDELLLTFLTSVTNVSEGPQPNKVMWKTVYEGTDIECTDGLGQSYYTLTVKTEGTIQILPVEITLTSDSEFKTYDGYKLPTPTITVSAQPVAGQTFDHTFTWDTKVVKAGEYKNTFETRVVWADTREEVDPSNYKLTYVIGTRVIYKRAITVTTESAEKFYDRLPLICHKYQITEGSLAKTDFATPNFTGTQTEVGESLNTVKLTVTHSEVGDVTDSYNITYVNGTLKVKPGKLYVASHSAAKVYDGTPLTCAEYDVDGLLPSDTLEVIFYGAQTEIGSSSNFFTVKLNGSDDLKYYELVPLYGTLLVTASEPLHDMKNPEIPEQDPKNPEMSDVAGGKTDQSGSLGSVMDENGNDSGNDVGEEMGDENGTGADGYSGNLDTSGTNGANNMIQNGENSEGIAMRLTSDHKGTVYMRYMNFGDYNPKTDTWLQANAYTGEIKINPLYFTAMRFTEMGLQEHYLKVALTGTQFMIPYYSMYKGDMTKETDVLLSYSVQEYQLVFQSFNFEQQWRSYYSELTRESSDASVADMEDAYAQFVRENYLAVPTSTAKVLKEIAEKNGWEQGSMELVNLIAAYIRNVAVYEHRSTTPCTECGDEVVCFLTHDRRGVCWEYAGAATLMYRYMGIPARLVSGYMANTVNGTVEVTAKSAHAWVEIYIDNLGWVQMEVTGSLSELPSEPTPDPDDPDTPSDTLGKVTFYVFNTTREFDGTEQFCQGGWLQGLPEGYTYKVIADEPGMGQVWVNSGVTISLRNGRIQLYIYDADLKDVTHLFEIAEQPGTLVITQRVIKVRTADKTAKQTGKPITADHAWLIQGTLIEGHTLSIYNSTWTHEAIRPGTYSNTFDLNGGWCVTDSNGVDQTHNYKLEIEAGTITVLS